MKRQDHVKHPGSHLDALRLQSIQAAHRGEYRRALDLAKRYHLRRPRDVGVLNHLAHMYQKLGDWAGMLRYGRRSYDLEPIHKHLGALVEAYFRLHRYRALRFFCRQELRRRPWRSILVEPRLILHLWRTMARAYVLEEREERRERRRRARESTPPPPAPEAPTAPVAPIPPPAVESEPDAPLWIETPAPAVYLEVEAVVADAPRHGGEEGCRTATDVPCLLIDNAYLKCKGLEERFEADFQALNLRTRFKSAHEGTAQYLGVGLYFQAESPDHDDGVLELWINLDSGAVTEWPARWQVELEPEAVTPGTTFPALTPEELSAHVLHTERRSTQFLQERLRPALELRQRDCDREVAHLQERGRSEWEAFVRKRRAEGALEPEPLHAALRDRLDAQRAIVRRTVNEHALHVRVEPLELRRLRLPVMYADVEIIRRDTVRSLLLTWNPFLRRFEPVVCHRCEADSYVLAATDAGQLLCGRCCRHASPESGVLAASAR
jgi:hypothetical protein